MALGSSSLSSSLRFTVSDRPTVPTDTRASVQQTSSTTRVYSPRLRTALVLSGTGTAGAYHAGVLRALHEAGVKIDVTAGRGIGAVGALLAAIDGAQDLWASNGLWQGSRTANLYQWRPVLRLTARLLGLALTVLLLPLAAVVVGALASFVAYLLRVSAVPSDAITTAVDQVIEWALSPAAVLTWLPLVVAPALLLLFALQLGAFGVVWLRARRHRRIHGGLWSTLLGSPIDAEAARDWFVDGLWKLMKGGASVAQPDVKDLGQRYVELLSENLGQPGFRDLLITVHDLDGQRDLAFALLSEPHRSLFFGGETGPGAVNRSLEALDLAGEPGNCGFDACVAALSLPALTESRLVPFTSSGSWRGETHRLCDRPDGVGRLLDEVARAGVEQVIFVSALPPPTGPHGLGSGRQDGRGRIGETLSALESAAERSAIASRTPLFQAVFEIRPQHNPLGPFDFRGCYDERSDRHQTLAELVERGYEDGRVQFVEPIIGASGEAIEYGQTRSRPRYASDIGSG